MSVADSIRNIGVVYRFNPHKLGKEERDINEILSLTLNPIVSSLL
jgi:hypothetical protein